MYGGGMAGGMGGGMGGYGRAPASGGGRGVELVQPSKVIHVRGLGPGVTSEAMVAYMSAFGTVAYVVMLPTRGQALVEFEAQPTAEAVMAFSKANSVVVGGKECYVNFSRSAQINRGAATRVGPGGPMAASRGPRAVAHNGENIILCTIEDAIYPITVDVMHTIMSTFGAVNRIVIFTKRGVQALVEFADPTSAAKAQAGLDGKEIYDGCCRLKIIFSRNKALNVHTNNERTFDFTDRSLPTRPHPEGPAGGRPAAPAWGGAGAGGFAGAGGRPQAYGAPPPQRGYGAPPPPAPYGAPPAGYGAPPPGYGRGGPDRGPPRGGFRGPEDPAGRGFGPPPTDGRSPVVAAFNISPELGLQGVFNLFGLYGNVVRIKMLPGKDGAMGALIQMDDHIQAEGAMANLGGTEVLGRTLDVRPSRHMYVAERREESKDGSKDYADYSGSPLNRFKRPEHFKHIYRPSAIVHFANCPPSFDESRLIEMFTSAGATGPMKCKFFAPRAGDDPARARKIGLAEWPNISSAVKAVALVNNSEIEGFTVRLAFSGNQL